MIGVDTNILVHYLTGDDPTQSPAAEKFLKKHCTAENQGWIGVIVLCELVWVLARGYKYSRDEIAAVIGQLLITAEFELEDNGCVRRALQIYQKQGGDFSDALIAERNSEVGSAPTYTFDQQAAKLHGFKRLKD